MKKILIIFSLLITSTCFADFMAERDAVTKFEKDEFLNDKNYPPTRPGQIPEVNKAFADKLTNDPVKLKYFVFLGVKYRLLDQLKSDKAFALSIESKFNSGRLTPEQKVAVIRKVGQLVFDDSNVEHKRAFQSKKGSDDYYDKILSQLTSSQFK